ncbi:DUF5667 domain-containing protein [Chloroflexota bacterium]
MEPLLKLALDIEKPGDIKPSSSYKIKARVNLMEQIHAKKMKKKWWWFNPVVGVNQPVFAGSFKILVVVVVALIVFSTIGGGTVYASRDSLPGDTLYPVKLGTERIRRTFTTDDVDRVQLELVFSNTRLREMEALANKKSSKIDKSIREYEKNIGKAIEKVEQLRDDGAPDNMSETVASAISEHQSILDRIEINVPEEAKPSIRNIKERNSNNQAGILRILAREDPVRAAKINLDATQSWLERAEAKAVESGNGEVEVALHQFEARREFGNEISQVADAENNEANAVNEMHARATSRQLEILGTIYGKVTERGKNAVERAARLSVEGHYRAIESLKKSGISDNIRERPQLPDGIPARVKERILRNVHEEPEISK